MPSDASELIALALRALEETEDDWSLRVALSETSRLAIRPGTLQDVALDQLRELDPPLDAAGLRNAAWNLARNLADEFEDWKSSVSPFFRRAAESIARSDQHALLEAFDAYAELVASRTNADSYSSDEFRGLWPSQEWRAAIVAGSLAAASIESRGSNSDGHGENPSTAPRPGWLSEIARIVDGVNGDADNANRAATRQPSGGDHTAGPGTDADADSDSLHDSDTEGRVERRESDFFSLDVRTITSDSVKFEEGIESFLRNPPFSTASVAPLLLSFDLRREIVTKYFRIGPSEATELDGRGHRAFISPLHFADVEHSEERSADSSEPFESAHLNVYSHVISALVTVLSGAAVVAPPDAVNYTRRSRTPDRRRTIGIWHPIRFAGSGASPTFFSDARADNLERNLNQLCDALNRMAASGKKRAEKAHGILQAIRLSHLGHLNRRVDHELGKTLMVAGLEACSDLAKRGLDPIAPEYTDAEQRIKEFCEQEAGDVGGWFTANVTNRELKKQRFIAYVLQHFPTSVWTEQVEHPRQRNDELISSLGWDPLPFRPSLEERQTISRLQDDPNVATSLLSAVYGQRSSFVHEGGASPSSPNSGSWIVDRTWLTEEGTPSEKFEPTFELLDAATREALFAWLSEDEESAG